MSERRAFIAGNWKMHKSREEAASLVNELIPAVRHSPNRIMVAPPFTALETVGALLRSTDVLLGAQNMGPAERGAHTGEVSVVMLRDLAVDIVILGHSERRHTYGEPDELINRKVLLALEHGMEVILCVGETLDEREKGITEEIVEGQMRNGLAGVSEAAMSSVTIAYEPVWAIGTGKNATPEDADAIHRKIRGVLRDMFSPRLAENQIIQYGGSVKPENIRQLMSMENIDGALVGGASLETATFLPIVLFNDKV
jgi:triosephosphate isomerase